MTVEFFPVPNINCDHCDEFKLFVDCPEAFSAVIRLARAAGWSIGKYGGKWTHTCPDCQDGQVRHLLEDYEP